MATFINLVRGINVGGKTLKMTTLKELYEQAGCKNVRTYIQSGNVVYEAKADVAKKIVEMLKKTGMDVAIISRTPAELRTALKNTPFSDGYITFLEKSATLEEAKVKAVATPAERWQLIGKELYLSLPSYGKTTLTNNFFEKLLGVKATTRNTRTVRAILEMTDYCEK